MAIYKRTQKTAQRAVLFHVFTGMQDYGGGDDTDVTVSSWRDAADYMDDIPPETAATVRVSTAMLRAAMAKSRDKSFDDDIERALIANVDNYGGGQFLETPERLGVLKARIKAKIKVDGWAKIEAKYPGSRRAQVQSNVNAARNLAKQKEIQALSERGEVIEVDVDVASDVQADFDEIGSLIADINADIAKVDNIITHAEAQDFKPA